MYYSGQDTFWWGYIVSLFSEGNTVSMPMGFDEFNKILICSNIYERNGMCQNNSINGVGRIGTDKNGRFFFFFLFFFFFVIKMRKMFEMKM